MLISKLKIHVEALHKANTAEMFLSSAFPMLSVVPHVIYSWKWLLISVYDTTVAHTHELAF